MLLAFERGGLWLLAAWRGAALPSLSSPTPTPTLIQIQTFEKNKQIPNPQVPTLEELYFTRTRLGGALPDTVPKGSRLRILYSWNVDPNTYLKWRYALTGECTWEEEDGAGLENRHEV